MKRRRPEKDTEKALADGRIPVTPEEGTGNQAQEKSAGAAGMILAGILLLSSVLVYILPAFHVQAIEVTGASHLDPAKLADDSGLKNGDHLFEGWNGSVSQVLGFRYGSAEERIRQSNPYIKDVRVRMDFPGTVRITAEERTAVSYLELPDGAFLVLDGEGIVLNLEDGEAPEGIPLLAGIEVESAIEGRKISSDSLDAIDRGLLAVDAVIRSDQSAGDDFILLNHIEEIRSPGSNLVYFKLRSEESGNSIQVKLGKKETLDDAMNWLRYTVRTGKLEGLGSGVLDLAGSHYVFIRDTEE